MLDVVVAHEGPVARIALRGELDVGTTGQLAAALQEIRSAGQRRVVVDLAGLDFVDVAGLRPLVAAIGDGLAVKLRNPSPQAVRLLEASGLGDVLLLDGTA